MPMPARNQLYRVKHYLIQGAYVSKNDKNHQKLKSAMLDLIEDTSDLPDDHFSGELESWLAKEKDAAVRERIQQLLGQKR